MTCTGTHKTQSHAPQLIFFVVFLNLFYLFLAVRLQTVAERKGVYDGLCVCVCVCAREFPTHPRDDSLPKTEERLRTDAEIKIIKKRLQRSPHTNLST